MATPESADTRSYLCDNCGKSLERADTVLWNGDRYHVCEAGTHCGPVATRTAIPIESEDFTRVAVSFGRYDKMQERMERCLAAADDFPTPRFWGASPGGMNATGESEEK